jgi:hypothetical protein
MRQKVLWLCREALRQLHETNEQLGAYVATPFRDEVSLRPISDRYQPVLSARVAYIVHDLPIFEFQHVPYGGLNGY